jgi:chromosomal replication initiator protein
MQPDWPEQWLPAYELLQGSIVESQLRAWIQPLHLASAEQGAQGLSLTFHSPNDFAADWVRTHFSGDIERAFSQIAGTHCSVSFSSSPNAAEMTLAFEPAVHVAGSAAYSPNLSASTLTPSSAGGLHTGGTLSAESSTLVIPRPLGASASAQPTPVEASLDPHCTFDHFIVGASNSFAHAVAIAVAEQPGKEYNPLFLYSAPGLGKTHLLHAIGHHVRAKNPAARVAYLSAERFVNELIESVQHQRMPQFRAKYRDSYDVLLIDDIQFIAGKGKTEEEFFHTFNSLYGSRRQIVVTSDRPPKDIDKLEERIRTRFEQGLVVDIQPPEIETRIAILKAKAERDDLYLPDEVATYLATHIKNNMRELEGILVRLQAQCSLTGAEISLELAKQLLKDVVPEEGTHYTAEAILQAVCRHFNLKLQELKSKTKVQPVARSRQIAMYLIRKYTGMGLKEIGAYFGGKDHSTVLYACKMIEKTIDTDPALRAEIEAVQNTL